MEGSIGNRYVPEKPIMSLPGGMIYLGTDLSLKRHVILYGVDSPDEAFTARYLRQLREASQFTGENFMHILDLGMDTESSRIVAILKPSSGKPLAQEIGRQAWSFEESILLICGLSVTMQKAFAEGITQFSVHAENLWLNEENQIVVMNYWEQGPARHRGVTGLCGLLYQFLTGAQTIPLSWESLELLLLESLRDLQSQQREEVLGIIRQASAGQLSLKEFTSQLRQQLSFRGERGMNDVKPASPASQAPSASAARPNPYKDEEQERIRELKQFVAGPSRPAARRTAAPEPEGDEAEDKTAAMELDEPAEEKRSVGWLAKRVLIFGTAFLCIVALAGFILIELIDNHKPNRGEDPSFAEQVPATPQTQQPAETAPKETKPEPSPEKPPASGEPVQAPSLIGLSREEAEKQALAYGLHYEFVIEASDQANNTVFKQEPVPNTQLHSGDNIKFWVSKGQ